MEVIQHCLYKLLVFSAHVKMLHGYFDRIVSKKEKTLWLWTLNLLNQYVAKNILLVWL